MDRRKATRPARRLTGRPGSQPAIPVRKRRISRREREARQQRQLRWLVTIAGVVAVAILAIGLTNEYIIKPSTVLATVDGTKIRRRDYWKVRATELVNEISQNQQFAEFVATDQQQQQQYLSQAQNAADELDNLEGSTDVDDATLARMVDDQIYVKNIGELGLSVSDQEIDDFIAQQFQPANAPIYTPTPEPTLIPTRAAWATGTALAGLAPTVAAAASPVGSPVASPGAGLAIGEIGLDGTPVTVPPDTAVASPIPGLPGAGSPGPEVASPAASPAASPGAGSPTVVTESPTPNQAQARQTAEAGYEDYRDAVFDRVDMSRDDYERWVIRPAVARRKVEDALAATIGQSAEQVHGAHILVATGDLARQVYEQVTQPGADFGAAARELSTDTSTAGNGGDLGWFTPEAMVDPFAAAAFALQPGEVSQPVQTEFGWHVITIDAKDPDRPLSDEQIEQRRQDAVSDWLEQQRAETRVDSDLDPTATAFSSQFQPPPDAPPAPTATTIPTLAPDGSPVASPVAPPGGNPAATPAA